MDVLIASGEMLPSNIRDLEDPQRPLPSGAQFFEERFAPGRLAWQLALGILATVAGPAIILLFLTIVYHLDREIFSLTDSDWKFVFYTFAIGAVSLLGGIMLLLSILPKYRLMKQQRAGNQTRHGIFLLDDLLIRHHWFDTTIIPRPFFKGLDGREVRYQLLGEEKTFDLPREIVCNDQDALASAIRSWAKLP
jgi:MFS family permease